MSTIKRYLINSRLCQVLTTAVISSVCLPVSSFAQEATETTATDEEVVYLAPFEVSAEDNTGYIASNSISGTRSQTPIRQIPMNIQVFTKDFATDLALTSQMDVERYNAALVNGGDDAHSNIVIQQAYNAFLFRGFIQNWGLRDGVRCYDPVDAQGLSRVEIVKGPCAVLYGLTYPGGVMNTITKSAMIGSSFGEASFTLGDYGEWRTTLDANVSSETKFGSIAIRYNGAYSQTGDDREHSDGELRFNQIAMTIAPTKTTTIKLLFEDGYRETPTALGYYYKSETDSTGAVLANGASIPLQEVFKDISYEWNWSTGNMRSCEDHFYKAEITQALSDNITINAYASYSKKIQIDSDGLDANGSSGAGSWDCNSNTGWINANTPSTDDDYLAYQYHYIDWDNQCRAYGITGVGRFDIADIHNTITAGAHAWAETFYSYRGEMASTSSNYVIVNINESVDSITTADRNPPSDYYWDVTREQHEESENQYCFVSWQAEFLDGRAHTTAGVNYTTLNLKSYQNAVSDVITNETEEDKTSPMFGAMYDITKEISAFVLYSTSLFPTTTKNSFEEQMPPTTAKSWEAGFKFEIMKDVLSGTISYYMITQTGGYQRDYTAENANMVAWDSMTDAERIAKYGTADESYRSQIPDREGQLGDYVAGEEQESKGFEADLAYQPMKNWQLVFSYAHNDVEISDSVNPDNIGNKPTTGLIADQFSLVSKYSFESGALQDAFVGAGCHWADESFQGYYNGVERYYPSTFYLEAFAGYKFKVMGVDSTIQLNVKNITEQEDYVGWKATGSADIIAMDPYEVSTPIRVSLTYRISF
jgi:outer membrane receptor protein involved in Fe transport